MQLRLEKDECMNSEMRVAEAEIYLSVFVCW